MDNEYLDTTQAARELDVSNVTILNFIKAKKLKGEQNPINRRWKILKSSVEKLLKEKGVQKDSSG